MKKTVFVLLLATLSIGAYSQKGNITVGAKGGYLYSPVDLQFHGILYGVEAAYHLSDPLEIAFSGLMNPNVPYALTDNNQKTNEKLAIYSMNLDLRLYLIHQQTWATGPALGGQYYIVNNVTTSLGSDKALGFNLGWHIRVNLTDNLLLNGGWRYTNAKAKDNRNWWDNESKLDISHHLFYIGISYMFEAK